MCVFKCLTLVKYIHYYSNIFLKCLPSEAHSLLLLLPLDRSRTAMSSLQGSYIPLFLLKVRAETEVSKSQHSLTKVQSPITK